MHKAQLWCGSGQMATFDDNRAMLWRLLLVSIHLALGMASAGCSLVVQYPMTSASAGVWGATGKGPTDHAVSQATGDDCDFTRIIDLQPICHSRENVQVEERAFRPIEAKR